MATEGNTEGTRKHRDSVETGREASADWSNLREDYDQIGSATGLARHYGVRYYTVRAELERQGIPIRPRGHVKGQKKSEAWREASRKHWDDPAWREEQRKKWLERLPAMQASRNGGSPLEKLLHRALRKEGISSVADRRSNGDRMRELWADPEWRAEQERRVREGRWGTRQMVVQAELHGPRENVQS